MNTPLGSDIKSISVTLVEGSSTLRMADILDQDHQGNLINCSIDRVHEISR